MDDRYRLVFRGEVLEGQHAAVVKQKLGQALKVAGERLDALFAGTPVVIRKDVGTEEAARYQAAFRKAGARLRVMPIDGAESRPETTAASRASTTATLTVAPAGELLTPARRRTNVPSPAIDTSHLSLAAVGAVLGIESVPAPAVEPPEWELADPGDWLSDEPVPAPTIDAPDWSVAAAGERLIDAQPPVKTAIDLERVDFPLAEPGASLEPTRPTPPAPPDTSHLALED
jgi:hypothetical protein